MPGINMARGIRTNAWREGARVSEQLFDPAYWAGVFDTRWNQTDQSRAEDDEGWAKVMAMNRRR